MPCPPRERTHEHPRRFHFNFAGIGSMMEAVMPRPIHITTPIEPLESRIRRLRISKARQKELLAIIDEAWALLAAERGIHSNDLAQRGEKPESASTAR